MKKLFLACTFVAVVSCGIAAPQQIYFPQGKPPSSRPLRNRVGGLLYLMVIVPDAPLLAEPSETARRIPHTTAFREVFLAFAEDASRRFYLVRAQRDPEVWGWINRSSLLSDPQCKRSANRNNPAFMKVALRNTFQAPAEMVSIYGGPGANYDIVGQSRLADILYVYEEKTGADGKNYLLVGWDAEWNPDRPNSICGWVRKDQGTIWDHRIAVYYNRQNIKSRPLVRIFRTEQGLKANDGQDVLARETSNSDRMLTYDRARFPILQDGEMMKIAFIGAPPRIVDAIHVVMEKARNMQVFFVIDGTISMGRYFQQVQKAVRAYIDSIAPAEKARYHFAVAVYRDYQDGETGEMEFVADFDDQNGLERLGALQERSDPSDRTLEEALFNGIIRSVTRASWQPGMLKTVVVIGDHPNHRQEADRKGYSAQSVVTALEAYTKEKGLGSGFRFHAINVNVMERHQNLNDEFMRQMRQIGNQFKPVGRFEQVGSEQGDLDRFRGMVTGVLHNVLETSERVVQVIQAIVEFVGGKPPDALDAIYGTEVMRLAVNILAEDDITPEAIKRSVVGRQIALEGWVLKTSSGQQLMEPWVYIERTELDEFRGFLASLMRGSEQRQRASQLVKDAVMRTTGDQLVKGETIQDYIKRAFALPFRGDSTLLSKTPEELQQALGNQAFWSQFRRRVGYSYEALALVSEERDPSVLRWDTTQNKWVRTTNDPAKVQSWVTSAGGSKFCWIPLDFIP
jgi:hypothetical protein